MTPVFVSDTTLRDGEQQAGLAFGAREKAGLALLLADAGVDAIEAGTPAMGRDEQKILRQVLRQDLPCPVIAWNRALRSDIDASLACGFSWLHVSIPVSDLHLNKKLGKSRAQILEQLACSLDYATRQGATVTVGAEDASRAEPDFFLTVAELAADYGAKRIRYADTVGCLEPQTTAGRLAEVMRVCPLPVEFHAHNDFGLATANTLAAVAAGVSWVSVTAGGIGERAGNAALAHVERGLRQFGLGATRLNAAGVQLVTETVRRWC